MYHSVMRITIPSIFLIQFVKYVECSIGDHYPSYRSCVRKCTAAHCLGREYRSNESIKWLIRVLWTCDADCEYECMWPMVRMCKRNGWQIPQFWGKWPFYRFLGMQEPASVFFSFLNLVCTVYMYKQFRKAIRISSTMYWIWSGYTLVSVNAWFWSILFHIRDVFFTERMDYIGASLLIYYTFYAFGYRILIFQPLLVRFIFVCGCLFFFIDHILYLIIASFDYRYNFDTLISIGVITGILTLMWCLWNFRVLQHWKYAALYVSLTMLVALLEIFDFAPVLWTFDAHSLWHLGTAPLSYFLFMFAIEDCRFLRRITQHADIVTLH